MNRCSFAAVTLFLAWNSVRAEELPEFDSVKDRASYGIGLNIGRSIQEDGLDLNVDLLARGLRDAIGGQEPSLSAEQLQEAMIAFQQELEAKLAAERKAEAEQNLKAGQAFLAANKQKPGVKTLESGLQYKVIKSGTGATPKPTDRVRTHYRGTLIDGTEFDSSIARGQPAEFPVNGVIPGWTQALLNMNVGDKWMLYVPPELAYGERGVGDDIGPNSVLIFQIELLGIIP